MSERALKRILGVAAVVGAIYLVTLMMGRGGDGGPGSGDLAERIEALDPEGVRAFRFTRDGDTIRLEQGAEGWRVEEYPVDSARVARFLGDLEGLTPGAVVAQNPANHGRLGVSEGEATALTWIDEDGSETTLLVGTPGPTAPSAHVRIPGEDPVYVLEGRFRNPIRRSVDEWRDRRIAAVDTAAVATVQVTRAAASYTLERAEEGWTVEGEAAQASEVTAFLRELASLQASGFAPDTATFPEAARRLRALDESGAVLADLAIAEPEEGTFWITSREGATIYEISSFRVDRLTPSLDSLRGEGV